MEEEWIQGACATIAEFKPDVVITEKGLSDLAAHYMTKAGISAIRRLRKTDNNRIARACGATIVNRIDEVRLKRQGGGGLAPDDTRTQRCRDLRRNDVLVLQHQQSDVGCPLVSACT
jgi:chaperonin GroEL (HSP60 family)